MSKPMSGKALVIQIGEAETRVACINLGAKVPEVINHAIIPTPAGAVDDGVIQNVEAMQGAINALRAAQPEFRKVHKAVFVLCSTQVIAQTVIVPPIKNRDKMDKMLRTNADMYFPVDIRDYQLTWQHVANKEVDGKQQSQIQLWAIPKSVLNRYYQMANNCGLAVAAIDYCGHSFATGINASFAAAKPVKKRKTAENDEHPVSVETTALYVNLEKDHFLMSFVQEDQVLLQRMYLRSDYLDTDLNEMFMEMEYFHAMFPACVSGDCIVSGSCIDEKDLIESLEEVAGVPLQRLHCEPDQLWCMCLGASLTELDFGDINMNTRGSSVVSSKLGKPWQYVLVALGGALLIGSITLNATSKLTWNTELQGLRSQQQTLTIQLAANRGNAERYNNYSNLYDAYKSDWETIFNSVRTYNDNAGLILEELEELLPKDAVVTNLAMTEDSLQAEVAFQEKEDVAYFLIALRKMEYATLSGVSDLTKLMPGAAMANAMGFEAAPTEGSMAVQSSVEAAPTAGNLAETSNVVKPFDTDMDFDALTEDILSGKTKADAELDAVVRKMLPEKGLKYYETTKTSSSSSSTSGQDWMDLSGQLVFSSTRSTGNTGIGGTGTVEPAGNYSIIVNLGYKEALIQAEQARKGLDRGAMLEKVVAE